MTSSSTSKRARLGTIAAGVAMAFIFVVAMTGSARADDRDWRAHEMRSRHWHSHPVGVAPVVYAPPVVYSAPPPISPGINLVVPLNFR